MAIIPVGQKFHTLTSSTVTSDLGSARANSGREIYTMQDIINTVSATGGSIDGSGVQYAVPVFTDTNTLTNLPLGTAGQFLQSQGSGANPTWAAVDLASVGIKTGTANTGIGSSAMSVIEAGAEQNTAFGFEALKLITTGDRNVAIGANAGAAITTSFNNILIGKNAGTAFTSSNLTAIGTDAAKALTTSSPNTALGYFSMGNSTSGSNNTCLGHQTGVNLSGDHNIFIGTSSGYDTTGSQNVYVGSFTFDASSGSNNIVIGYDAQPSSATVSNEITLGDANITTLRCAVNTITLISDERDKTDVVDISYGLEYVTSLKPRQWTWSQRPRTRVVDPVTKETEVVTSAKNGSKDVGFVAQELQSVDNEFLRLVNDSNPEHLQASWVQLIPVLVKAIQELKEQLDNKQDK